MKPTGRMNWAKASPAAYRALLNVHEYLVKQSGLDPRLMALLDLRVSQINGCAFCVDMHWKDLRALGESEERLYMTSVWRESNLYSARERAALAWAEAVTTLEHREVPDEAYEEARREFSEAELANLTLSVCAINSWNRMNIAFLREAGTYQSKLRPIE
ncbi:MAG: carboxymuconolactone decarboxylase family protein [Bryobacterales bacterium]|nr:carboxymuconolactone decarboxylase family protein [Bryobacterales bacterium]